MKQEPLKRRRPAARKRGRKQTFRAVVLSVLTVSVIALCLGIWTKLPGEDVPVGGIAPPEDALSPASSVATPEPEPEPEPAPAEPELLPFEPEKPFERISEFSVMNVAEQGGKPYWKVPG